MSLRWIFLVGALTAPILFGPPGIASEEDLFDELLAGRELASEQAAALEQHLTANPQDLNARARLLGYYFGEHRSDRTRQTQHVLWFIRNAPESEVLEWPETEIMPMFDPEGYAEAKEAWLRQLENEPRNAVFLKHAANFFALTDTALSSQLLARGGELDPSNPHWAQERGHLRWLEAHNPFEGSDRDGAALALADFERAYELASALERGSLLDDLGKTAFVAGEMEKARGYAEAMLKAIPDDWNGGNRIHYGNLILGRLALADGDLEEARARLIAAGQTPGSSQLNSFGPDMALAKKLLEHGETRAVVRYLELCGNFWEMDRGRLKEWIVLIEAGRTPDFSFNLRF